MLLWNVDLNSKDSFFYSAPSLATWGAAAGSAVLLLGSDVPLVKKDLLSKIPIAGRYWATSEEN